MVELFGEPIETDRAKKLRDWLGKPEGFLFKSAIEAKLRLKMEEAIKSAMQAGTNNTYGAMSELLVAQARRYQTALDVIAEIADKENELHNIRLRI